MPSFDIIGSNAPGYAGAPAPGSGFDIVGNAAGGFAQQGGVPGAALYQGLAPQPGAPISGSVAGLLGLPTMAGPDGTTRLVQGQGQMPAGQPQPGGQGQGAAPAPQQPNLGSAIGSGLRSLFDGVVYGAQSMDV